MTLPKFDPTIDYHYAENGRLVVTSGEKYVSMVYALKSHFAAAARIAELEARIAELEATQPLPEWTGNRNGVTAHTFNGASHIDTFHEVITSGRLP